MQNTEMLWFTEWMNEWQNDAAKYTQYTIIAETKEGLSKRP